MKIQFEKRWVFVTGGAGGLGSKIVEKFLEAGATVFALDKDEELLEKLKAKFPSVITLQADLCDWAATKKTIEAMLPLDHLVNNAGIFEHEPLLEFTEGMITRTNNLNYTSYYNTSQIFAKSIMGSGAKDATIVNISSVGRTIAAPEMMPYCVSKAAVDCFSKNLAVALGPSCIRVNAIQPSGMQTPMLASYSDTPCGEKLRKIQERAPIQGGVDTEDVAHLVLYLSSPFARMITGQVIAVDGGLTIA